MTIHSWRPTWPVGDFGKFFVGQTISNLGNSVTFFAVPILVYSLTGSALDLGLASAVQLLPYLLFGLVIGAWVDRVDRRRLMIAADLARAAVIASIPAAAALGWLSVGWIYGASFIAATISIAFDAAQFAAIPSLVPTDDLVAANGRIQASFSAAAVVGPLLAGLLLAVMPVADIFTLDALSFLISAASLAAIRRGFNTADAADREPTSLGRDIVDGLRYVLGHPVLRAISLMMALVNFVGASTDAQLVLFAHQRLGANDSRVGMLYAAGSLGVVATSLVAGRLRRRWSFGQVALGALLVSGALNLLLAFVTNYWVALPIWALFAGLGILFNINTGSLRQAIVPNHLLGRVISIAGVLAWSAIPLGSTLGGVAVERTNIAFVYGAIGAATMAIAGAFAFSPIGRAERYLPSDSTVEPATGSAERAEEAAVL
ncbi:MAG TPA: MFS transporter [Thermomicrobiales bacterium]|nr:MFS transporter [Thermomicrobiales bacterium]